MQLGQKINAITGLYMMFYEVV